MSVRPAMKSVRFSEVLTGERQVTDAAAANRRRRPWGRCNPTTWVRRPDAYEKIINSAGTEIGCATYLGVARGTLRGWLHVSKKNRGWIPKDLAPKLDEYLNSLGILHGRSPDDRSQDDGALAIAPPLVELIFGIAEPKIRELANLALRRDNSQPQPEGAPIPIDCHVSVGAVRIARDLRIGIGEFSISVRLGEKRRGICRAPTGKRDVPGIRIHPRNTPDNAVVFFSPMEPANGPLSLNGLDPAIPLCIVDRARAGETVRIELEASLDHGFVCVRKPSRPGGVSAVESINRNRVISHLSTRATLGEPDKYGNVILVVQTLSLKRAAPE
jgi:hypothetical protein